MLKKFISIRNVGRFQKYGAVGDVELKRYNLFFAENGRGKTTLCAILRSLQSGAAAHVLGRTTLGSTDAPEIRILSDAATLVFSAGAWSNTVADIAIFDSTFISENVFSGDSVDIDHKRSLYRVIVGKDGVALAKQIEDLDAVSRAKAAELKEKAAPIQVHVPKPMTLDAFLALKEDAGIDEEIAAKEKELEAVRQADHIKARAALSALTLPALPTGFQELLAKSVEGIAQDAEHRVAKQIQAHAMHARGEAWLSEGLGYVNNNTCPFCGQALAPAAALLAAYKAYFSAAYNELRTSIGTMRSTIETAFGDKQIAQFEKTLDQNLAGVEFWSKFCDITAPALQAGDKLRSLRQAALVLLDRKAAAPLEHIAPDAAFTGAATAAANVAQELAAYNQAVRPRTGSSPPRRQQPAPPTSRLSKRRSSRSASRRNGTSPT